MKKILVLFLFLCSCSSVEKKAAVTNQRVGDNVSKQRVKLEAVEKRLEEIIEKL